ncbi:CaiB/BaiF CoA transferase family protein [Acuticoccus mangrovi]|uniref:CoA transferase n=1 Tax=Acuticoccus mangrovi TaxID=2796142 RepID=A0A934IF18_9HYPH|nr:CaiB/BaiF CoA-transferase family protein [Acuticoccus mangrovi]MBJ3775338.1 CoA transferase [Acuticoccus mangrovi]
MEGGSGPLQGIRIVEIGAIGPGPFCAMLLADMGADVLRLDRTAASGLGVPKEPRFDVTRRGRPSAAVDLKHPDGVALAKSLIAQADGLIEGFRPGVMERLGLGPDDCAAINPRLVYGRMTGWGQDGPLAHEVGHDINYLAISGALGLIGRKGRPPAIPLNLVADYGGGALYLALGLLAALIEAQRSGRGQVVDAAILDGVTSLLANTYGYHANGRWTAALEENVVDGGAPFYNVYETRDGRHVAIGAIEAKFYAELLDVMALDPAALPDQFDRAAWPAMCERFAAVFKTRTRAEWDAAMAGRDACYAPVLSLDEAMAHPQIAARHAIVDIDGVPHAAPAPRFSRTPARIRGGARPEGADTRSGLAAWGVSEREIARLHAAGAIK